MALGMLQHEITFQIYPVRIVVLTLPARPQVDIAKGWEAFTEEAFTEVAFASVATAALNLLLLSGRWRLEIYSWAPTPEHIWHMQVNLAGRTAFVGVTTAATNIRLLRPRIIR